MHFGLMNENTELKFIVKCLEFPSAVIQLIRLQSSLIHQWRVSI